MPGLGSGNVYTINFTAITLPATNAIDVFEVNAPSDAMITILGLHWGQWGQFGDSQSEILPWTYSRSTGSSGTGGSQDVAKNGRTSATSGATCDTMNTTRATTLTGVDADVWNVQAGHKDNPIPEEMWTIPPSGRMIFSITEGPAVIITSEFAGSLTYEEYD